MHSQYKILSIVLAIMLAASNLVFSGHSSSHSVFDSELCTLCIHYGGSDSAILPHANELIVARSNTDPVAINLHSYFPHAHLYDSQSRAPPLVT